MSRTTQVAGVIFDLDGTLGETLPVTFEAFRIVLRRDHGVTYTDADIRAMFGPSERGVLEQRANGDTDALLAEFLAVYAAHHHLADRPFVGMKELLDSIHNHDIPMAVVTGKGPESADLSLRHWGIDAHFTHVLAGSDGGDVKVQNMAEVIAAWGMPPDWIVAIGDIAADVHRARKVGLRAVAAAWSTHIDLGSLAASEPEAVFTQVPDFAAWLMPQLERTLA